MHACVCVYVCVCGYVHIYGLWILRGLRCAPNVAIHLAK